MKQTVRLWQWMGFAVTSFVGTLLHFLYEWTNEAVWLAPFSGVNESTWEHMKLLFWPMLLFAAVQSFFFRAERAFWCVKLKGILLGLALIPTLFYTYNGVFGKSPDWLNISIFFVAAALAYAFETCRFNGETAPHCTSPKLALGMLCLLAVLFAVFTFVTPELGIFRDPLTGAYGL